MDFNAAINSICKPLLLFLIFGAAHITYNLTQFQYRYAMTNLLMTVVGSSLIYFLCQMGFEFAAWLLIFLVPFFFVSLLSFMVLSQLISTDVRYWNGPESGVRQSIQQMFGSSDSDNCGESSCD